MYKEYYKKYIDNWGSFDTEYYIILNCIDRINNILIDRYGSAYKASTVLGYAVGELNRRLNLECEPPNIRGLKRLLPKLDISYQYAILGEGERKYTVTGITFNNLKKIYTERYVGRKNPVLSSILCKIKNGETCSVPLKFLIRIAREQRVTIDWLLGG